MKRILTGIPAVAALIAASIGMTAFETRAVAAQEADERRADARPGVVFSRFGGGAYLGVSIEDMNAERADEAGLGEEYGVYVSSVVEEGPAASAGLMDGDVIVRWNGERLESVAELQRRVSETPAGRTVSIGVVRDGADRELSVELGDRASSFGDARVFTLPRERLDIRRPEMPDVRSRVMPRVERLRGTDRDFSFFVGGPRLGVSIQSLGDQLAEYFDVDGGALITSVQDDSPAAAAGLRAGDVILRVGDDSVDDPGDVMEALSGRDAGPVDVTVSREGANRTITVELEEGTMPRGERGGVYFFDREGEGGLRFFGGEGRNVVVDPISIEGFEMEPLRFEGIQIEPMELDFEWGEGDPIEISIPRIDVPGFELDAIELPGVEIPGFEFRMPRVEIIV